MLSLKKDYRSNKLCQWKWTFEHIFVVFECHGGGASGGGCLFDIDCPSGGEGGGGVLASQSDIRQAVCCRRTRQETGTTTFLVWLRVIFMGKPGVQLWPVDLLLACRTPQMMNDNSGFVSVQLKYTGWVFGKQLKRKKEDGWWQSSFEEFEQCNLQDKIRQPGSDATWTAYMIHMIYPSRYSGF